MKIRYAKQEDVSIVLSLIKELAAYEKMSDEVVATEALLSQWLFEKKIAEVMLLESENRIIGFALYFYNYSTFVGRGGIYLEDIYIQPAYRGRGYGKSVFYHLAKIAREQGLGRIEWSCLNWNTPSIEFYHSLGAVKKDDWLLFRLQGQALKALSDQEKY